MDKIATALHANFGGKWKEHPKAAGYYFSDEGGAARGKEDAGEVRIHRLKGCECGHGYRAISHPVGGGRYGRIYIHRAVCELFNGAAPNPGLCVRHLDTDLRNNRAANLAWGTALDNADDARRAGKTCRGEKNPMAKLTKTKVEEIRRARQIAGRTFKQLADEFGVSTMTAFRAVAGQSWN